MVENGIHILEAFLHAHMDRKVHILLEGIIAELIIMLALSLHQKYLWYNKNGKLMICTTFAPFYVMLQASLLFWKFLSKSLHDHT